MATLCVERAFFKSLAGRLYQIRSDLDSEIFKSNYWPRDFSGQLNKALEIISEMFHDYNNNRPHGSLSGLTPAEALTNVSPEVIVPTDQIRIAVTNRISENLNSNCKDCQPKPE